MTVIRQLLEVAQRSFDDLLKDPLEYYPKGSKKPRRIQVGTAYKNKKHPEHRRAVDYMSSHGFSTTPAMPTKKQASIERTLESMTPEARNFFVDAVNQWVGSARAGKWHLGKKSSIKSVKGVMKKLHELESDLQEWASNVSYVVDGKVQSHRIRDDKLQEVLAMRKVKASELFWSVLPLYANEAKKCKRYYWDIKVDRNLRDLDSIRDNSKLPQEYLEPMPVGFDGKPRLPTTIQKEESTDPLRPVIDQSKSAKDNVARMEEIFKTEFGFTRVVPGGQLDNKLDFEPVDLGDDQEKLRRAARQMEMGIRSMRLISHLTGIDPRALSAFGKIQYMGAAPSYATWKGMYHAGSLTICLNSPDLCTVIHELAHMREDAVRGFPVHGIGKNIKRAGSFVPLTTGAIGALGVAGLIAGLPVVAGSAALAIVGIGVFQAAEFVRILAKGAKDIRKGKEGDIQKVLTGKVDDDLKKALGDMMAYLGSNDSDLPPEKLKALEEAGKAFTKAHEDYEKNPSADNRKRFLETGDAVDLITQELEKGASYFERSLISDLRNSKRKYYADPSEMFARAFEIYILRKMKEKGFSDYDIGRMGRKEGREYLDMNEPQMEILIKYFDKIFSTDPNLDKVMEWLNLVRNFE